MEEKECCPCCENHCAKDALACGKGRRYFSGDTLEAANENKHRGGHHGGKKHHHEEAMDTDEKLRMLMRRCGHILWHRSGGKASQERVLRLLVKQEAMTQKELLEALEVKPGSLSELLGKLEANELIIRKQNEQDKRGVDVCLSEQGKQAAMTQNDERSQQTREMFACLDEEEKDELLQLLDKLLHSWKHQFHDGHHHKDK